ncbi:MAG: SurA N-terminal domain-containing protein [Desulfobacterales bacterium]
MLAFALALAACGQPAFEAGEKPLAAVGEEKLFARDFHRAFELRKTAYPGSLDPGAPELREARERLLEELVDELLIRQHARQKGIAVGEEELEAVVASVRAQYPEGAFEQALVEAAVPLEEWKARLRSRLLLEKVMQREFPAEEPFDAAELQEHYERHFRGKAAKADSEEDLVGLREVLVDDLRRKKREEAFSRWVESLRRKTPVQVDPARWEAILSGRDAAERARGNP